MTIAHSVREPARRTFRTLRPTRSNYGWFFDQATKRAGGPVAFQVDESAHRTAVEAHRQRREHRDDRGRPGERQRHLAGDAPPGRQGPLPEHQPAQRVGDRGDRLVGGERLQPARHGLGRDKHRAGERQREHPHVRSMTPLARSPTTPNAAPPPPNSANWASSPGMSQLTYLPAAAGWSAPRIAPPNT